MFGIFLESLGSGYGLLGVAGWIIGFTTTLRFGAKRALTLGVAILAGSAVLILACYALRGVVFDSVLHGCKSDVAHLIIGISAYLAIAIAFLGALGAGMLCAGLWTRTKIGSLALSIILAPGSAIYVFLSWFATVFAEQCFT